MLDGFDDHDADRENKAEERDVVDRESEGLHRGEGANQRNRNRDERDERRAPGLKKEKDDENNERDCFKKGLLNFMDRLADRHSRIVDNCVVEAGWEALL